MVPNTKSSRLKESAMAVIMGGGRGTRLWPLTKYRAKPAVPVAGKYRLIDIPISICLNSGVDRIYILTQFNSSSLNRHVSETFQLGAFSGGFVALEAANQRDDNMDWYQGTADAVRRNLGQINQWQTDHLFILPGDTMFRMDLREMLDFHVASDADLTIALHPTSAQQAPGFGILQIDDNDKVLSMVEKPKPDKLEPLKASKEMRRKWKMDDDRPFLASMGMYLFRRDKLNGILNDNAQPDFGQHIVPRAVRELNVKAFVFNGFWEDIGTIEAFYNVNLAVAGLEPPFRFYVPGSPIHTRMRSLPASRTHSIQVNDSNISEGCFIEGARLDHCMIGIRSIIGRNVTLKDTILMGADYYEFGKLRPGFVELPADAPLIGVGNDCHIERAIIDKNARIGDGCRITNEAGHKDFDDPEERYYVRDGIIIVPKDAILPPGTVI